MLHSMPAKKSQAQTKLFEPFIFYQWVSANHSYLNPSSFKVIATGAAPYLIALSCILQKDKRSYYTQWGKKKDIKNIKFFVKITNKAV